MPPLSAYGQSGHSLPHKKYPLGIIAVAIASLTLFIALSNQGATMQIRRLAIENVRSFLDRREISFDGQISILIGPNGGGKTNLLDTLVIMLRRYIFNSPYYSHSPTSEEPDRWIEQHNDQLNNLFFEKNSAGGGRDQVIELELEITQDDVDNMMLIKAEASQVLSAQKDVITPTPGKGSMPGTCLLSLLAQVLSRSGETVL